MLKITIPFTEEIVFNSENYADYQVDEVIVNRFDEVRDSMKINVKTLQVDEITVFMIDLICPGSVLINAEISKYAWIMNFILSGQLCLKGIDGDNIKLAEKTHQTLLPAANVKADMVINGQSKLFVVCLEGSAVKRLLSAEEETGLQKQLNQKPGWLPNRLTSPNMHSLIALVIECSENNCLHRIFLAAKMLELLFLDMEQLINNDQPKVFPFKINDLDKLEKAKGLIGENIQAPCSLIELAHKVGLNDFKLKKGFREAFGTTVFGYLLELRMEKAKNMLSSSRYSVGEVAYEVGYKNAHHFTVAFKKRFGYLPSKLNK